MMRMKITVTEVVEVDYWLKPGWSPRQVAKAMQEDFDECPEDACIHFTRHAKATITPETTTPQRHELGESDGR